MRTIALRSQRLPLALAILTLLLATICWPILRPEAVRAANLSVPYITQYQGLSTSNCDCGPASIAMILRHYGLGAGLNNHDLVSEVRQRTGNLNTCVSPSYLANTGFGELEQAISSYGLTHSRISSSLSPAPDAQMQAMKDATSAGKPVIALINAGSFGRSYYGHWVVVKGFSDDGQSVYLNDPDSQSAKPGYPNWIVGGSISVPYNTFKQAAQSAPAGPYGIVVGNGGGSSPTPSITGLHLDVFARGNDGNIYHRYFYNSVWANWESLSAPSAGTQGDPGSVSWGPGRVDLFVRGGDNQLWSRTFSNDAWGVWAPMGGGLTSAPDAASWGPGHLDVFARGNDGNIYHRYFYNNAWSNWEGLGAPTVGTQGGPAVVASEVGRVHLFVRGGDNQLWAKVFSNGAWGSWATLNGTLSSDPDIASWGPGHLDVVARFSNNQLYHRSLSGSWGDWVSLGAPGSGATSSPSVVSSAYSRLDFFVRGSDNALWQRSYNQGVWSGWMTLYGGLSSGPDAASMSN